MNNGTGQPVVPKRARDVFRARCNDPDSEKPWSRKARYSKNALTPDMIAKRFAFATHILATGHAQVYYYNRIIWADICNSMLPRTEGKASEQALARKGKHGWLSLGNELASPNLRGAKESEKQASWGTSKVWWAPVLARGKVRIKVFDGDYPGKKSRWRQDFGQQGSRRRQ